jgi:hypothetical protein
MRPGGHGLGQALHWIFAVCVRFVAAQRSGDFQAVQAGAKTPARDISAVDGNPASTP